MLRNRRTHQTFFKESSYVKAERHCDQIAEFVKDFSTRLPNDLDQKTRTQILSEVHKAVSENYDQIDKIANSLTKEKQKYPEDKSFIVHMAEIFQSVTLGSLAPIAMLLLSGITPAAAAQTNYMVHNDMPSGGTDLCSGYMFGCAQGYLTQGDTPWNIKDPQFSRLVQQAIISKSQQSDYMQLRDCMTLDKTGQLLVDSLQGSTSNKTGICMAESTVWRNWQVSSQVTKLPDDACETYKDSFTQAAQKCQSAMGSLKQTGKLVGYILGGAAGAVVLAAGLYFCYQKCRQNRNDSCFRV